MLCQKGIVQESPTHEAVLGVIPGAAGQRLATWLRPKSEAATERANQKFKQSRRLLTTVAEWLPHFSVSTILCVSSGQNVGQSFLGDITCIILHIRFMRQLSHASLWRNGIRKAEKLRGAWRRATSEALRRAKSTPRAFATDKSGLAFHRF